MIDIKLSEQRIVQELQTINGTFEPNFKLTAYPGDLISEGKPIRCNTVQVRFKNINFDNKSERNFNVCKVVQQNVVYFQVLIQGNNLRDHTLVYVMAENIIEVLRGKKLLINRSNALIQGQTPLRVTDYNFNEKIKNGGACYESYVEVSSTFTDVYDEDC